MIACLSLVVSVIIDVMQMWSTGATDAVTLHEISDITNYFLHFGSYLFYFFVFLIPQCALNCHVNGLLPWANSNAIKCFRSFNLLFSERGLMVVLWLPYYSCWGKGEIRGSEKSDAFNYIHSSELERKTVFTFWQQALNFPSAVVVAFRHWKQPDGILSVWKLQKYFSLIVCYRLTV